MNAQVSSLSLYDIAGTPGVAADVSHINTKASVKASGERAAGREGRGIAAFLARLSGPGLSRVERVDVSLLQGFDKDGLAEALRGCDLVIIPAGVPRKPGMTRDDLFKARNLAYSRLWHQLLTC
jgi:malate dehydrogenase